MIPEKGVSSLPMYEHKNRTPQKKKNKKADILQFSIKFN